MSSEPFLVVDDDERSSTPKLDGETIDEKKNDSSEDTDMEALEKTPDAEASQEEYPSGLRFFFVIVALVLSTFLIALDMVKFVLDSLRKCILIMLTWNKDNRCNGHSKDH